MLWLMLMRIGSTMQGSNIVRRHMARRDFAQRNHSILILAAWHKFRRTVVQLARSVAG